ncbi:MAG: DUF4012 domain-containing protein [Candidatus Magasanikbacteria bacterium]|nr:DUF4012 domain-containing protein [Candidatus Magasanikbacteria bacterium]
MPREKSYRQLRRCGTCQKAGHNKATCPESGRACPEALITTPAHPRLLIPAPPLKFFVHHVSHPPVASPHIIDTRNSETSVWKNVKASAPEASKKPLYHFYHELKQTESIADYETPIPNSKKTSDKKPSRFTTLQTKWGGVGDRLKEKIKTRFSKQPVLFSNINLRWAVPVIVLVIIMPRAAWGYFTSLKNDTEIIAKHSQAGFMALQESTNALKRANFEEAETTTAAALQKFNEATTLLSQKHQWLKTIASTLPFVGEKITGREKLVIAGQKIALGNSYLLDSLSNDTTLASSTIINRLNKILAAVDYALPNYQMALEQLEAADPKIIPVEYQTTFQDIKKIFGAAVHDVTVLSALKTPLRELLGGNGRRRFLIIFQNQHELRATGGFMGSYAIMEVKNGQINSFNVPPGGSYDVQGQLDTYLIPPTPLLLNNKRWEFQDANWFPDFPTSAEKILWFYRHSRGISVDGVIAVNSSVLERILGVFGPLVDHNRGVTLQAKNSLAILEKIIETGPEKKANKPKQILTDLAPNLLATTLNATGASLFHLLEECAAALEQKEIQIYSVDNVTEDSIAALGWAGAILPTQGNQDYLLAINTNIQGEKSDRDMKQTISHQSLIQPNGEIINTVTITREHTGAFGEKLYGTTNIDYLRLYVPTDSTLLSVGGFSWPDDGLFRAPDPWTRPDSDLIKNEIEVGIDPRSGTRITKEFGKYAFGNWMITEPGKTSRLEFVYRLPFKAFSDTKTSALQLVAQRQSGSETSFESQIIFPDGWEPVWQDGSNLVPAWNGAHIPNQPLKRDTVWSLLMKKKFLP